MYKNYTFEYKRFTGMNGDLFFYFETKLLFSLEMVLKIYFIHFDFSQVGIISVSYTHLTLPTNNPWCRSRWSPYH